MEYFTRPTNLDGAFLLAELNAGGIIVDKVFQENETTISLDISSDLHDKAASIIAVHKGATE